MFDEWGGDVYWGRQASCPSARQQEARRWSRALEYAGQLEDAVLADGGGMCNEKDPGRRRPMPANASSARTGDQPEGR